MKQGRIETITTRIISTTFMVVALAVFKPFGLDAWQWQAYVHLAAFWVIGFSICMSTDIILKYIVKMPRSFKKGVEYIIRRNLWFQFINTPLVALGICLYRHFVLSDRVTGNQFSVVNFLETLAIIAFCSFAIGLYWRFKYRSRYLAMELEETRQLNEQLKEMQSEEQGEKALQQAPEYTDCQSQELTLTGITPPSYSSSTATNHSPSRAAIWRRFGLRLVTIKKARKIRLLIKNVYLCTILKLKIMKKLKISILSAIFIVCSNVAQTAAAQNETMVFTPQWTAQAQFAGYYVAEAKERVIEVAEKALANQQQEPKQLISIMTDAVHQFVGNAEQSDDLTMMGIQYIKK